MSKKDNISSFQIAHSKIWADGEKYFSLFEKHIPELEAGHKVLVYDISNLEFICKLMSLNKDAEFWIYGNQEVNEALRALGFSFHEVAEDLESKTYNIPDMKFDCIIMNPPYTKNFHLKILVEAIKHLKDDESKCVNLSPVRWLQDPLAKYKKNSDYHKFEDSVSKHIESLDVIDAAESNRLFGIQHGNLAVYTTCSAKTAFNYEQQSTLSGISKKVLNFIRNSDGNSISSHIIIQSPTVTKPDYYVYVLDLYGGTITGSLFIKPYGYVRKESSTSNGKQADVFVKFLTENSAINFANSARTNFFKYLMCEHRAGAHYYFGKYFPWMGDVINPRTGKKGYEGEWTDDDFYVFFNITPEEQKVIEETMEKYK